MANILGMFDVVSGEQINSTLKNGLNCVIDTIDIGVAPETTILTAVHGASVLLACSGSNLEGRTQLIVKNTGMVKAYLGKTSSSSIHEEGIVIGPGQSLIFKLTDATIELYARSAGYATSLEIMES